MRPYGTLTESRGAGGRRQFLKSLFLVQCHQVFPACYKSGVQPRTVFPVLCIILFVGAGARNSAQTQSEMNVGACEKLRAADAELNRIYQQVLVAKSKDANFVTALRGAQAAWIAFRDAHVKSVFPDSDPRAYGSVYPMCRCNALEQITSQRVKEFRQLWTDGAEEGEVCCGSCTVKPRPSGKK